MAPRTSAGILSEIVVHKRSEVEALLTHTAQLQERAFKNVGQQRPFAQALGDRQPAVIAEIKKASPSKGLLQPNFDPASIARTYEDGGAACLSVLTDHKYFQGSLADLSVARDAVSLPVLRKDFTIHPVQIYEAAAHGADAILLIAAILNATELRSFRELAGTLGLAALVEVHNKPELAAAIESGAQIIGVNNRNLDSFEVSLETSLGLSELMPKNVTRVSESGISKRADIDLLRGAGFHAFLIGECLMKARDAAASLRELVR
jgi:indole-3-glycerol phosphate synthase